MPIDFLASLYLDGPPPWMPATSTLLKYGGTLAAVTLTKRYCSGAANTAERDMHGRVVMVTGGTSGIGAVAASELARRGAQVVLLTRQPPSDPFLAEFVHDLRERTGNQLVYAEQVDLASLHSVRLFATRWVDNAPPRRLDMVLLCGATLTPPGGARQETPEGVEHTWMVNFLANFHLLGILSPALRAQPFDRDVRIVIPTCSSYIGSPPLGVALDDKTWTPRKAYARSKLALMVFGQAYQKHLDAYKRPDKFPMNAKVVFVDPGFARTAGMTRWLTRGSLLGLFVYVLMYFWSWLLLKSPFMAAQSILYATMEGSIQRDHGGKLIKECREVDFARRDVQDEAIAKELWEASDKLIEKTEKLAAQRRAKEKKEAEKREKEQKEAEKAQEIESLVDAIKKGKAKQAKEPKNTEKDKEKDNKARKKAKFSQKAIP